MGVRFKPVYMCEGCGAEFETEDSVRLFKGTVENGNGTKVFIQIDKMYCLNCLPLALDFENNTPETVQIVDQSEQKFEEIKQSKTSTEDILCKIEEFNTHYQKILESQQNQINELFNIPRKEEVVVEEKEEEIVQEEFIEEPEEEPFDEIIPTQSQGKYVVLYKILTPENENEFAKRYNYKDIKTLRQGKYNDSLIGLYYSRDGYIDNLNFGYEYRQETVKVVNKMFFGIPNIVNRDVYIFPELGIAVIEKEYFDDKIEPVRYIKPVVEEVMEVVEERPSSGEENVSKKSFLKNAFDNDDDYI